MFKNVIQNAICDQIFINKAIILKSIFWEFTAEIHPLLEEKVLVFGSSCLKFLKLLPKKSMPKSLQ